jgi:diphthamide biosynthesis protein 2
MTGRRAPPQLLFDDGSRIINSELHAPRSIGDFSVRGCIPIYVYYEIARISQTVLDLLRNSPRAKFDGWLCRIALQFPDSLLGDAAEVCWAMEEALTADGKVPLVFILGDTTFGSCCPDEVSALHLEADVLIHFGHACLSPAMSLPVVYSFGASKVDVSACVDVVVENVKRVGIQRILLLFQVQYFHAIEELQTRISEKGDVLVVAGLIPQQDFQLLDEEPADLAETSLKYHRIGGLEIPSNLDFSTFTVLYIGDPSQSQQYINIMLRFTSMASGSPSAIWTFKPIESLLETSLPPDIQRQLNRRFFLTQKARDATTFGILVGTLSQRHFASAVASLQKSIQDAKRSCYTFAVGKVNVAKLANFGEIDCYVLVACSETSLLDFERDIHVPVITPLELDVALGNTQWGDYSLDYNDFLVVSEDRASVVEREGDDAPYFSLVSGSFQDSRRQGASMETNLVALPGQGQLASYDSKGAEFLRRREYQGLDAQLGQTEVHAAVTGQNGIASNYCER